MLSSIHYGKELTRRILGPLAPSAARFLRRVRGRLDEVDLAFRALRTKRSETNRTMVDVGAHYGSSCEQFARSGWRVFAFEPDAANRLVLQDRVGRLPNVEIVPLAVSDRDGEDVPL
ncbi:MAG: hypothetical protein V2A73_15335, partial [Pseudomonadota bacterium]